MRELLAREALAQIPKLLTLQDRNPHSPTFGCFDRNFWHYKIIDFPSGILQTAVWPLAQAYHASVPSNPFFQQPALKAWTAAGILYAARSAHADGSCDDYFPFEKASGAAAFSLLACLESCRLFGFDDAEMRRFFERRASWLAEHHESGQLTNHQALVALCLALAGRLLGTNRWDAERDARLRRVFAWQNAEGWFQEYEGADPGYHTLTIGVLAQIYEMLPSPELRASIEKAVRFAAQFVHPDGSAGGEYASRNTYNFFPHGFELVAPWLPEATAINDQFLRGLANGLAPCYADDHIIAHHTWSLFLAWEHFASRRAPVARPSESIRYPNAGLMIQRRDGCELYLALNKGGAFKFFREGKLVASDTGFSLRVRRGGKIRNAVGHLVGRYDVQFFDRSGADTAAATAGSSEIRIAGSLGWAKHKQMTTFNLLALRLVMLSVGRFFPDLVRRLLQKMLITGKADAPGTFTRRLAWSGGRLRVADELHCASWDDIVAAGIGCAQTSIYVVMSRVYQAGQLAPSLDLTSQVRQLRAGEPLRVEREL